MNIRCGKDRNVFVIYVSKLQQIFGTQITTDKFTFFIDVVDSRCRVCYLLKKTKNYHITTTPNWPCVRYGGTRRFTMCNRLDIITLLRVSEYTEDTARSFMFLNVFKRLSRTLRNRKPERYLRGYRL